MLWSYDNTFVCKENQISFFQQFLLFHVSLHYTFTRVPQWMQTHVTWQTGCFLCTLAIFTMSLFPFWVLNVSVVLLSMQGQKCLGSHLKYLNSCSKDEQRSYGFGTTWGWVINDRILIWENYPFKKWTCLFTVIIEDRKLCNRKYYVAKISTEAQYVRFKV